MFEWDPEKAAANLVKHGIGFEEATTIFSDPDALDVDDVQYSAGESRKRAWGLTTSGRAVVAYTIRRNDYGEEAIRIISARPANRKERARYAAQD